MAAPDHQTVFPWTPPCDTPDAASGTARVNPAPTAPAAAPASRAEPRPRTADKRTELPPDGELWDVADAARFLKMSTSWVYKRVEAGVLPCVRVDGWSLRFVPADLRGWAAKQPVKRRVRRAATTKA